MNHEEFAAECPALDMYRARKLCEVHGANIDEYIHDTFGGPYPREIYDTLDLCRWLGY